MTHRLHTYFDHHRPQTPCLVIDLDEVEAAYRRLRAALPIADIRYAVKANPARDVISRLAALGCGFDAASVGEIDLCLGLGVDPNLISYGNTIKKTDDIAHAHAVGVSLFAFDSQDELEKLAHHAPGARVFCRILLKNRSAGWAVTDKFGCCPAMAVDLLCRAGERGLRACGVSFHVGSQQTDPGQWDRALTDVARIFTRLRARGVNPDMINIGGGMPVTYDKSVPDISDLARRIARSVATCFPKDEPVLMLEPGRILVATAGMIESTVITVARKSATDTLRWVYLDVGTNGGLIEAINHNICYPVSAVGRTPPCGPVVIAGPTCDWADIIRGKDVHLPLDVQAGDRVRLLNTGAYTAPCATVGFNGMAPLVLRCI